MFVRNLILQLRKWRENINRKPLVLRGARQVGKTTLVKEFGKEFDAFISLNLEKEDADIFRKFSKVEDVWQYVCMKHHLVQDRNKKTLLFIDEIQEEIGLAVKPQELELLYSAREDEQDVFFDLYYMKKDFDVENHAKV